MSVLFQREVCVHLNETISTEEFRQFLGVTIEQYTELKDDSQLRQIVNGNLGGLVN